MLVNNDKPLEVRRGERERAPLMTKVMKKVPCIGTRIAESAHFDASAFLSGPGL